MRFDKQKWQMILLLIICLAIFTGMHTYGATLFKEDNDCQGIIRFHVVANSDSDGDQELKLKVRDGLLDIMNEELIEETMELKPSDLGGARSIGEEEENLKLSVEQTRSYINKNISDIEKEAEKIVNAEGYDYEVTATLGICYIPQKKYGDITFPAGNYEALNVKIGEAKGHNWWCVLFPPLCLIDGSNEQDQQEQLLEEKKSNDVVDSLQNTKSQDLGKDVVAGDNSGKIILKSKTLELLDKMKITDKQERELHIRKEHQKNENA